MRNYNVFNSKEWAAYIALRILHPFMQLFGWVGKKIKKLTAKQRQITASVLIFCMVLTMLPLGAFPARAENAELSGSIIVVDGSTYALTASGLTSAITAAADGDTIDIRGNITLDSTVEIVKSLTILSSYKSSLIRGSGFSLGYMLTVSVGKTLTVRNITLDGNHIESSSAIYLSASHLVMEDGAVIKNNNTSINNGGGIFINSGTFNMNGGSISNNTAVFGGGVFIGSGTFTQSGGTISDNTATSSGGGVYNKGTFTMVSGTISNNTAIYGGGMYVYCGTLNMCGGNITSNKATGSGGGVLINTSTFNASGSACITDNAVGTVPNNVYLKSGQTISVTGAFSGAMGITKEGLIGSAVTGNITANNKDQFFIDSMIRGDKYYDTVFVDNQFDIQEVTDKVQAVNSFSDLTTAIANSASKPYIDINTNIALMGAVSISGSKQLTILSSNRSIITRDISLTVQMFQITDVGTKLILREINLDGNSAVNTLSGVSITKAAKLILNPGAVIQNNCIKQQDFNNLYGGGVYNHSGVFVMNSGTISGNTAIHFGGGVYNYNGTFIMNGGAISSNTASEGGGVQNEGIFTLNGGAISGNTADYYGGGVQNYYGNFTMNNGTISGNGSSNDGGGVYNKGTFTMSGGNISGNTAKYGGGVYYYGGTSTINGGAISGNTANYNGGGVYNYNGDFTMGGGNISGNTANYGGGVHNDGTFTMNGGNILSNTVIYNGGGVFISYDSTIVMNSGTITGNKANNNGGGVYISSYSNFTMSSGNISGNSAKSGGGVFNDGTLVLNGGGISGNEATFGGGVQNNKTFTMDGSLIFGNSSYYSGGGVYNWGGTFTMNSGTISDNKSTNHNGGGVYNQGPYTMNGGNMSGNAAVYGGGVYNVSTFTMRGGIFSDNRASYDGGGVCNNGTFTMGGGIISGNTASYGGGGVHNGGVFNIQGASTITNNRKGVGESAPVNNVYLATGKPITVTGVLSGEIGVNMQTYGPAAVGNTAPAYTITQSDTYCFKPDVNRYASHLDSANNTIKILLLPVMASLSAPTSVTAGNRLLVAAPVVTDNGFATSNHRFEIKKTGESFVTFDPQNTVLDISYNGASLRYAAEYTNGTTKTIYSGEVPVNVIKAAPALLVDVNPVNSTTYDNEVVLTATFSDAYIPSGTIQFKVGGTNLGDPVAISGGEAVYCYTPNANDTAYSYTAVYSGDANNKPANSAATSYTVNKANQSALTVTSGSTVTFGNTYTTLVSGGTTGGAVTFEIIGGTGEGSFDGNVLTVTKAGTIVYTAKMTGGTNYNDVISSAFTLTVNKANSTISINNDKTVTYFKNEVTYAASDVTLSGSSGAITFSYYSDIACTNEISVPINAGTYYVKAILATDDNYNSATSQVAKITINPKPVNITGVAVYDKVYDGQNTATISSSGIVSGVISGDTVLVKSGVCTFNSVNVGNSIPLTVSGFGIEGVSAGNYNLISQPTVAGANITPATLSVSAEKVIIKTGQQIPPLTVLVTGFVNGETENNLSGYEKPIASVSGEYDTTKRDLIVFNVSYSVGNATDNYKFQYSTAAQIEIQSVDINDADFSADYDLTKWHKGDIKITSQNGYTQISIDKTSWSSVLTLSDEGSNEITFYLKKPDGTLTESKTISYKIDNTAPTGEITIKENKFRSFIKFISFGVFCKNNVDVTITGKDNLSSTTIEYMVCEDADITGHSYQKYADTFSLGSKGTHIVFAKITDEAGNEIIICSDGVVVYEDSTANTEEMTYEKLSGTDKSATVNLNGNTVDSVMVRNTILTSSQCSVDGNTITLKGDYLKSLVADDYTVKVSYSPQGLEYDPTNSEGDITYNGDEPTTTTFIVKVVRKPLTVSELVFTLPESLTYNGSTKAAFVSAKPEVAGIGSITVSYYNGDEKLTSAPVNAGSYTVNVSITDGVNYSSVSDLTVGTFTITNASQPAPSTPKIQNNNGKITGVDSSMEYKRLGDSNWIPISGTEVTGLSDGVYLVRYAAKANYNASEATKVAISKAESEPTIPNTGDKGNMVIWIVMLFTCGSIFLLMLIKRKSEEL